MKKSKKRRSHSHSKKTKRQNQRPVSSSSKEESFIKKEIEIPRMLIFIPYTGAVIYLAYKNGCTVSSAVVYALESIAGGICGGILRFLISHEKKAEKTQGERASKQKGSLKSEITKIDPGQAKKRRPGRIKKAQIDDDVPTETEIGTL